jgi:transcriptional regulator with XRE-family HTH domain
MECFKYKIGQLVRQERVRQNMTRERLSMLASIDCSFLYMIEIGKKGISLYTFLKIAEALKISPDKLLIWDENEIHTLIADCILEEGT